MSVVPSKYDATPPETTIFLSFQDFVSEHIAYLAKYAYEQEITRRRHMLVAYYQCQEATHIDLGTDGDLVSIKGRWSTDLSYVGLDGYKEHLINLHGKQDAIEEYIEAANEVLDLLNPERQCLLYLQQGIFLPEHNICWNDERIISDVVEFPSPLSEWYKSTFVTSSD